MLNPRTIDLTVTIETNMTDGEIANVLEGSLISLAEFGKEGIPMPRYEEIFMAVRGGEVRPHHVDHPVGLIASGWTRMEARPAEGRHREPQRSQKDWDIERTLDAVDDGSLGWKEALEQIRAAVS